MTILRILPAAAIALALGAGAAAAHERATGVIQSTDRTSQTVTLNNGATFQLNGSDRARDFSRGEPVTFLFENGPTGNDVQRAITYSKR